MDNDAPAIELLWRQYAGASWLPANKPTAETLNDWTWQRARLTWPYEPGPVLSRITCPVLAMWEADDESFPPAIHKPRFESSMRAARNPDYTPGHSAREPLVSSGRAILPCGDWVCA
jgi:pimeloyl-ACP methyl ester carboxylesterase